MTASGAVRKFLQDGVIEGWRCQEKYVIPVRNGRFDYDFRSHEFGLRISGEWIGPGTVKGSIFTVGLPTEYFTVSLDVPNP